MARNQILKAKYNRSKERNQLRQHTNGSKENEDTLGPSSPPVTDLISDYSGLDLLSPEAAPRVDSRKAQKVNFAKIPESVENESEFDSESLSRHTTPMSLGASLHAKPKMLKKKN